MRRRWAQPFVFVLAGLIGLVLVGPMLIVIPMSFSDSPRLQYPPTGVTLDWYGKFFRSPMWTDAAWDSLTVALLTVAFATALGTLAAVGIVRGRFRGRSLVGALMVTPLGVPVVVIAIGMLFVFSRWHIQGTTAGLVAAHTAFAMPFVVVTVGATLRTLDPDLELAARSLGAGPVRAFGLVTVPMILPGVVAGALFAFATSWDEVIAAIFLSSPLVRTLPVVMWTEIRYEMTPTVAAVATMMIGLTAVTLALVLAAQRVGSRRAQRRPW